MISGIYIFEGNGQGALNIKRPVDNWFLSDNEKNDILKSYKCKDFKELFIKFGFKFVQKDRFMECKVYLDFKNLEVKLI